MSEDDFFASGFEPGPRSTCPNVVHDYPLPEGYIAAASETEGRLRRRWRNPRCRDCGLYGWAPPPFYDTPSVRREYVPPSPAGVGLPGEQETHR